jgi:hypothetical protein
MASLTAIPSSGQQQESTEVEIGGQQAQPAHCPAQATTRFSDFMCKQHGSLRARQSSFLRSVALLHSFLKVETGKKDCRLGEETAEVQMQSSGQF